MSDDAERREELVESVIGPVETEAEPAALGATVPTAHAALHAFAVHLRAKADNTGFNDSLYASALYAAADEAETFVDATWGWGRSAPGAKGER